MVEPGGVDQADVEQVSKVGPILIAEGGQLDLHQRLQAQDAIRTGGFALGNVRIRKHLAIPDHLSGKKDVNGITSLGLRSVEKEIDLRYVSVLKADGFESGLHCVKVASSNQQIDILGVPDRRFIDARDPGGDGVAADDGIGNSYTLKSAGRAEESFADAFHGPFHSIEGKGEQIHRDRPLKPAPG